MIADPARDLVLQSEQIARVTVEPLGPQMHIGLSVDQLGLDPDPITRSADATFQDIAHIQLAADLLGIDLVGERGIA
jgi:hypothetical protein